MMVNKTQFCELAFLLIYFSSIPLQAVTVNPSLCPTNKIAPHRRIFARSARNYIRERTFGAFYDLLAPNNGQYDQENDLLEKPQVDDPDDCGDIEDYDETDLSSITPQTQRRVGYRRDNRFFLGPSVAQPTRPPTRPPYNPPSIRPPPPPQRPPYWSGGLFGNNGYRPPIYLSPSDFIKPIHEYSENNQVTYRPNLVGAPLGHIVGASPIRPTTSDGQQTTEVPYYPPNRIRQTTLPPPSTYNRRPKARYVNNNSVFGSFVDLLFK